VFLCYSALAAMRFKRSTETDRIQQLARKLEAAAQKDEERKRETQEVSRLRARAAMELHAKCAEFVEAVNRRLPAPLLELSPAEYSPAMMQDADPAIFQIGFSGRLVHLEFHATETPRSTERFRTPYILEGSIRSFNQELLELAAVPEQFLFCCPVNERLNWMWFDPRIQRAALLDQNHLIALLERLL
jgi:hypothetical protein